MLRRIVDTLLSAMLVAALLPMVILSALCGRLRQRRGGKTKRRAAVGNDPAPKLSFGEFQFERAVEAYESLIDAVLAENRTCTLRR